MTEMARDTVSFLLESLVMSVIILAFLSFSMVFFEKFSAKLRYAVWTVLLAGLLFPLNMVIGGGFIAVPLEQIHTLSPLLFESQTQYDASGFLSDESSAQTVSVRELTAANVVKGAFPGWITTLFMLCIFAWGIVAATILIYQIVRYFRFVSSIRRWGEPVTDETTLAIFQSIKEEKGLGDKKIELRICEFVSGTLLTGFFRPMVVLPKKHFEADELDLMLRHELIHYKRRDLFVKFLSLIAVSIHWYNPVVHWMNAVMQTDGEVCCDEAVLRDVGDENRQFYAELMIKMVAGGNTASTMLSTSFFQRKKSVKRRLNAILSTAKKRKMPAYAVLAVSAALTVLSGSVFTFPVPDDMTPLESSEISAGSDYLTPEQAKELTLATVGGGTVGRIEKKYAADGEIDHYIILLVYDGSKYDATIDARDGSFRKLNMEKVVSIDANVTDTSGVIGDEAAISVALEKSGGGIATMCRLEAKPLQKSIAYHIHVAKKEQGEQWEHCVEVDAMTGFINYYELRYKP